MDPAGDVKAGIGVLLLSVAVAAAAHLLFWNSGVGRRILDQSRLETVERMRGRVPDATLDRVVSAPMGYRQTAVGSAMGQVMSIVSAVLLWTAAVHLTFSAILLRPETSFGRVLAVFGSAASIWTLGQLVNIGLMGLDGLPRSGTSLPSLVPRAGWPEPWTFRGAVLVRVDVLDLWWVPVVSAGVARLYGVSVWRVLAATVGVKLMLVLVGAAFFRPPADGGAIAPFGHGF